MNLFLFLLSILISSIFYFRISKRFSVFDMELSEDIKRELTTLITEFNSSAKINIEIIEDRIKDSKEALQQLLVQLEYAKKLKENLESELKDSHRKLSDFKETQRSIALNNKDSLAYPLENRKSYINNLYDKLGQNYGKTSRNNKVNQSNVEDKVEKFTTSHDSLKYNNQPLKNMLPKNENTRGQVYDLLENKETWSSEHKDLPPSLSKEEDIVDLSLHSVSPISINGENLSKQIAIEHRNSMQNIKKAVKKMHEEGAPIDLIANKLKLTKGEVNFMVRLLD